MSNQNQTPIPAGHAVRVLFVIRANKGLYGYSYGPFRYDETRKCYVYQGRTYSVEQWEQEGAELIQKYYKYRCGVKVEIVKDETASPAAQPAEVACAPEPALADIMIQGEPTVIPTEQLPASVVNAFAPDASPETPAEPPVRRARRTKAAEQQDQA